MTKGLRSLLACVVVGTGLVAAATPASAQATYKVYVSPSATALPVGRTVTLAGSVSPNAAGRSVKLQRYYSGAWRGVATKILTSSSRYAFSVKLTTAGVRSYRIVKPSSGGYSAGISRTVRLTGLAGYRSVSIGFNHACALKYNKTLWCWGSDYEGQLGLGGGTTWRQTPVRIGTSTWNSVTAGESGTCGVRSDNTLWCWGSFELDQYSQVPIAGFDANRYAPTRIGTQTTWSTVSTGAAGVCARRTNLTVACWTRDDVYSAQPNNVVPKNQLYNDWHTIQVGPWGAIGCGLRGSKQMWCLPPNSKSLDYPALDNTSYWTMFSSGYAHGCGVKTNATAWCWGSNTGGATGPNPTSDVPLKFDNASWRTLAAGRDFTCGIKPAGSLWCWGSNEDGRLGAGASAPSQSTTALRVGTASDWTSIATAFYGCGTRKDGSLWCWGNVAAPGDDPSQPVTHPTPFRMG